MGTCPMKEKDMSPRKNKFLNGVLEGKSGRQAALDAGCPNENAASQYAKRMYQDVPFCNAMAEALEKAGGTREKMAGKVNAALDAKDSRGKPDWKITLDAVKLGCQINKDIGSTDGNKTTVAIFDGAFLDKLIDAYHARQTNQA